MTKIKLSAVILTFAVILTSCQAQRAERQQQADLAFCQSIGAGQPPALAQCMLQRDAQNQANRRVAIAANQQAINNAINQPWVPRTQTTTCRKVGIQVVCNTF